MEIKGYRYGFNGMEKDDEISGAGNSIHYSFREYDSRLGRMKSADPQFKKYPSLSTYSFVNNNPIQNIEADGRYFVRHTEKYGHHYVIHVTDFRWINAMTDLTAIPVGGLAAEFGLAMARAEDPSYNLKGEDLIGLGFTAVGFGSLKLLKSLGKIDGIAATLLQLNRDATAALIGVLSEPETFELGVEYLAIKSLEHKGLGEVSENQQGKQSTAILEFNNETIDGIKDEILADDELTSKEDFNLDDEILNRLSSIMEDEKDFIKEELKSSNE
jgi:RHS repeat-associated protein